MKLHADTSPSAGAAASSGGHIRALDGLRGIAILMVLAGHFYPKWLIADVYPTLTPFIGRLVSPGGYGVELFFVLSGFLITGILLDTKEAPGFLTKFYARRVLRIFPLYYGALAIVFFVLPLFVTFDAGARAIADRQLWLWAHVANWPTGWIWDDSRLFLLGHFWSLSVEEHFYLVWPAIVAIASPRGVFRIALALAVTALACRGLTAAFGDNTPVLLRWATLHKLDGLAVGAMLATAVRVPARATLLPTGTSYRRWMIGLGVASLAFVMLPRRLLHHPFSPVFGETIIAAFFGLVLLGALRLGSGDRLHRPLASPILVTFGKYSYGLYVIHGILRPAFEKLFDLRGWPTSHGLPFLWLLLYYVLTIGASLALAYASYHGFEKWFLNLKRHFEYSREKSG